METMVEAVVLLSSMVAFPLCLNKFPQQVVLLSMLHTTLMAVEMVQLVPFTSRGIVDC